MFVLGGPGAGKGTVCERLLQDPRVGPALRHLSAGQLLREEIARGTVEGARLAQIILAGGIVSSHVTVRLLRAAMAAAPPPSDGSTSAVAAESLLWLIDGFPRNMENVQEYELQVGADPLAVLNLTCSYDVIKQRIMARARTSGREDDTLEVLEKRLLTFEREATPVLDHYRRKKLLVSIDSSPSQEQVAFAAREVVRGLVGLGVRKK